MPDTTDSNHAIRYPGLCFPQTTIVQTLILDKYILHAHLIPVYHVPQQKSLLNSLSRQVDRASQR